MNEGAKIPCVELSRPDTHPGMTCTWKMSEFDIHAELDDSEVGDMIQLRYVELTQEQFDDLGDFDGW